MDAEKLKVVPMEGERAQTIYANLSQAYEAEFSPLTGSLPDTQGRYALQTPVDAAHPGFLLMEGKIPVGFMVISLGEVRDVAEFYVTPGRRRTGYGLFLASHVFSLFPGDWQVRQIQGADHALRFWRAVLDRVVPQGYEDDLILDPLWGRVRRQRFRMPGLEKHPCGMVQAG